MDFLEFFLSISFHRLKNLQIEHQNFSFFLSRAFSGRKRKVKEVNLSSIQHRPTVGQDPFDLDSGNTGRDADSN